MAFRPDSYRRYVASIQYHGLSFAGAQYLGSDIEQPHPRQNKVKSSVLGRLRHAIHCFVGGGVMQDDPSSTIDYEQEDNDFVGGFDRETNGTMKQQLPLETFPKFENVRISSRTDRGVHAIKNTIHFDLRKDIAERRSLQDIHYGINFYLNPYNIYQEQQRKTQSRKRRLQQRSSSRTSTSSGCSCHDCHGIVDPYQHMDRKDRASHVIRNELRLLRIQEAPRFMPNPMGHLYQQPDVVDWHVRFSAISRTYVYRILQIQNHRSQPSPRPQNGYDDEENHHNHRTQSSTDWNGTFEWDRCWHIPGPPLNVSAMQEAAAAMIGTHDFSNFRVANCQRKSPIVTVNDISLHCEPYHGFLWTTVSQQQQQPESSSTPQLPPACSMITIRFHANSFLYRQVRLMTGTLVEIGRGKNMDIVREFLKGTRKATHMAPAHGLFLVDVQHVGVDL
jgi:tRNA pseudouridine38-40 synthase